MQIITKLLVFSFMLILSACAHKNSQQPLQDKVAIAENTYFTLLAPATLGKNLTLTQLAEIQYSAHNKQLIFQTEINKDKIIMLALTPSGTRLFSLVFDGVMIEVDGYAEALEKINPHFLLADMQMSLWPLELLNQQLHSVDNQATYNDSEQGLKRTLKHAGKTIIEIFFDQLPSYQSKLKFIHHQRNYSLSLTTLSVELSHYESNDEMLH